MPMPKEQVVARLNSLPTIEEKLEWADANLQAVSKQGTTRNVYILDNEVLKIAQSKYSVGQNQSEVEAFKCSGPQYLAAVTAHDETVSEDNQPNFHWLMMEKVDTDPRLLNFVVASSFVDPKNSSQKMSLKDFAGFLSFKDFETLKKQVNPRKPKVKEWLGGFAEIVNKCNVSLGDAWAGNLGIRQSTGLIVLLDYADYSAQLEEGMILLKKLVEEVVLDALKESESETITLNQLYDGDWPDENELLWNYVGPDDMDMDFPVVTINPVEIFKNFKPDGVTPMWEVFKDHATKAQKRLVTSMRKKAASIAQSEPIVVFDDELVDGFHRVAAMALEGITSAKAVNLMADDDSLEEQNTLASGNVVGYTGPLGMDTRPGHKAMWKGKQNKSPKLGSPKLDKDVKALVGMWKEFVGENVGAMHDPGFKGPAMPGLWKGLEDPKKALKTDSPMVDVLEGVEFISEAPIVEPKRKNPTNIQALDISPNGGVNNILKVYKEATQEEKDYWGQWYHNAKEEVVALADKYLLPFPVMAAIVAVLSPGNKWRSNVMAADRLLDNAITFGGGTQGIPGYPREIKKAKDILETGDVGKVRGPKVTVFFKSLLDPVSVANDMVLDGHAMNIWRGKKEPLKVLSMPNKSERAKMIEDYEKAAEILGVEVQAVQAVTWYIWKYTNDAPVVKPKVFDVSQFASMKPENDVVEEAIYESGVNQALMKQMGYDYASKSNARIGSDTYVQQNDPKKARSKKIAGLVNKNLDKTRKDPLHDPAGVGISIPRKAKG